MRKNAANRKIKYGGANAEEQFKTVSVLHTLVVIRAVKLRYINAARLAYCIYDYKENKNKMVCNIDSRHTDIT